MAHYSITIKVSTESDEASLLAEIENELEYFLHAVGCELGTQVALAAPPVLVVRVT